MDSENNLYTDASCKRLFANKEILARLLKGCVQEFADCNVNDIADKYIEGTPEIGKIPVDPDAANIIRGMATEDSSPAEGTITFDIRFMATIPNSEQSEDTKESMHLIINVEPQGRSSLPYPLIKRAVYYCARMISAQKGSEFINSHYEKIKKVYSIWVCLNPPKDRRNTITQYSITEKNLTGNVQEIVKDYDLISIVMVCLGDEQQDNPELLKLLDMIFSNETAQTKIQRMKEEFWFRMTQELESEVLGMCDLREVFFDQGIERGIEKGIEIGRTEGIEIGIERNKLESIRSVIRKTGWTVEDAMNFLDIPQAEHKKYFNLLEQ